MRLVKRTAGIAVAAFLAILLVLFFQSGRNARAYDLNDFHRGAVVPLGHQEPKYKSCDSGPNGTYRETWKGLRAKYDHLIADKFTIALNTFHRPKELKRTLDVLTAIPIPSLHEIVIIWNNFDEPTPATWTSKHGVPVRYRKPDKDTLNEKLWPDPSYETQGILLSDDDVYYRPHDLEFVFQSWRKFGQERMTGALSRCLKLKQDGTWNYDFCTRADEPYSIVLTNLAFTHIGFLDYYHSSDPVTTKVRSYVDKNFNCEDLGLNFVSSLLTGQGPLLVRGYDQYVNVNPSVGISQVNGHKDARSSCINEYAEMWGCMPLQVEEARIERGHRHNAIFKTVWDRVFN